MATCNGEQVEETAAEERERRKRGQDRELVVERQVGARTFSRLAEMCGEPIVLFGQDQRLRNH